MNWRALALFSWSLAIGLGLWEVRDFLASHQDDPEQVANAVPSLVLASPRPVLPSGSSPGLRGNTEVPAAAAEGPACVRLGKFPSLAWARHVAGVLAPTAASDGGSLDTFRVRGSEEGGYFIVFPTWSMARLDERITLRAAPLERWLSRSARPEPCQPAER